MELNTNNNLIILRHTFPLYFSFSKWNIYQDQSNRAEKPLAGLRAETNCNSTKGVSMIKIRNYPA